MTRRFQFVWADAARWRAAVLALGKCPGCGGGFRDACAPEPQDAGCLICAPARLLMAEAEARAIATSAPTRATCGATFPHPKDPSEWLVCSRPPHPPEEGHGGSARAPVATPDPKESDRE